MRKQVSIWIQRFPNFLVSFYHFHHGRQFVEYPPKSDRPHARILSTEIWNHHFFSTLIVYRHKTSCRHPAILSLSQRKGIRIRRESSCLNHLPFLILKLP